MCCHNTLIVTKWSFWLFCACVLFYNSHHSLFNKYNTLIVHLFIMLWWERTGGNVLDEVIIWILRLEGRDHLVILVFVNYVVVSMDLSLERPVYYRNIHQLIGIIIINFIYVELLKTKPRIGLHALAEILVNMRWRMDSTDFTWILPCMRSFLCCFIPSAICTVGECKTKNQFSLTNLHKSGL